MAYTYAFQLKIIISFYMEYTYECYKIVNSDKKLTHAQNIFTDKKI